MGVQQKGTRSCQELEDVSKAITFGGRLLGSQERKGTKRTLRQWDPYIHSELYPVLMHATHTTTHYHTHTHTLYDK